MANVVLLRIFPLRPYNMIFASKNPIQREKESLSNTDYEFVQVIPPLR